MTDSRCRDLIERLSLGEPRDREDERHTASCEACRVETERFERLIDGLAREAQVEPPAAVDRRLREILSQAPVPRLLLGRPALALGLALAAFLALVGALAGELAGAGAGDRGLSMAVLMVWIYLGVCAAATLPLLLARRRRQLPAPREV